MKTPTIPMHPDEVQVLLKMVREIVPSALSCGQRSIAQNGVTETPVEDGFIEINAFAAADILDVLDEFPGVINTPTRAALHVNLHELIDPIRAKLEAQIVAMRRRVALNLDGYGPQELPF